MPTMLPLKSMSRLEKLREMEALWADLSRDEQKLKSPAWHRTALQEAEAAVKSGKAKFSDWDEAKTRLRRQTAARA